MKYVIKLNPGQYDFLVDLLEQNGRTLHQAKNSAKGLAVATTLDEKLEKISQIEETLDNAEEFYE